MGFRIDPRQPLLPLLLLGVLSLIAGVLLTACGGPATGGASKSDPLTLRIGAIGTAGQLNGVPGYLQDKNQLIPLLGGAHVTAVKVHVFANGPDLNQALAAGDLDLGIYGDTPALVARGAGQPTRLISQATVGLDAGIVTRKGGPASLQELEGRKVAVAVGSYMDRYLRGALAAAGVKPASILNIPTAATPAALERGDIDAAALPAAHEVLLQKQGYPVIDVISRNHPDLLGTSATVVTQRFLDAHPGFVKVWQDAIAEGTKRAKAGWDDYLAFTVQVGGFPPDVVTATTLPGQLPDRPFTDEGLRLLTGTKEFLVQQKLVRQDFSVDEWLAPGART